MQREVIEVPVISEAIRRLGAPTSALVRAGGLLFTCGMPPVDCRTGDIVRGDIAVQTRAALDALQVTLAFAGSSLAHAVKTTVFITDPALMGTVNAIYRERFPAGFPARTSAGINPWPAPFDIEIECIAIIP
jgi:2-iminobutanoate/2-iminopropanoate deaminase